jgi:hypothetical protein
MACETCSKPKLPTEFSLLAARHLDLDDYCSCEVTPDGNSD